MHAVVRPTVLGLCQNDRNTNKNKNKNKKSALGDFVGKDAGHFRRANRIFELFVYSPGLFNKILSRFVVGVTSRISITWGVRSFL